MKRVLGTTITLWIAALVFLSLNCAVAAQPHNIVENFTARLNSSDQIHSSVVTTDPWRGVGHAHLTYKAEGRHRRASLFLPDEKYRVPGPGTVKMWVKGDGSGNNLRICVRHARVQHDRHGRRRLQHHEDIWSRQVKLDFAGWKRLSFDMSEIPDDRSAWWRCLEITVPRGQEAKMSGKLALDEFVQIPKKSRPKGAVAVTLIGPRIRNFSRKIAVSLDVRNFTRKSQEIKARVVATDRNENLVLDRDFTIKAEPFARISADENKTSEHHLELVPDQIARFLPPFKVQCDVGSELTDLSVSRSFKVVMGNSIYLFDDLSDVYGRWFTAGGGDLKSMRHWPKWIMGEQQRYSPFYQTSARLTRVPVEHKPTGKLLAERYLGKYAMKFDYRGNAAVYMTRRRYLPGNAYRMGVWVKGDGNGAELWARFLDYTDNADFWPGGWQRIGRGGRVVCKLDFTDWRYFELELPGGGIGRNTPRGSTDALDFPLELTAFRIEPGKEKSSGSVQIGAIHVHTQQPQRKTLAVQVGYEDAERRWWSEGDAWAAVQNSWPGGGRKVRVTWNLLDRKNEEIASGQKELGLNPVATANVEIPLSKFAAKIEKCLAPFRLQVVATDTEDFSTSTTRELIIAKPDSSALVADFEAERGYLGMLPRGMERKKPAGEFVAWTSAKVSHGGQRSLAINWKKEAGLQLPVSVDPPLPGVPVELSLWVHGDGKGEIMYPLIGDKRGVSHGAHGGQWDLFLPRTSAGKFQNVVKVDWKGWKKLTFNLPVIPPTWQEKLPVLGFEASYPLGVHLMVDGRDASAEMGTIYVDDLRAETHLAPQHRVNMRLRPMGRTNVLRPGEAARVLVTNHGMADESNVEIEGGIYDWRGRKRVEVDEKRALKPMAHVGLECGEKLPVGAYKIALDLKQNAKKLEHLSKDFLVGDLSKYLGSGWEEQIDDSPALKRPLGEDFARIDEDWDWVEHYPGNVQLDTLRYHIGRVREDGAKPWALLGYSAYYAAGVGFEQMMRGAFQRRKRDAGHAVDVFLVPERMDDWDHYTCEVMRGVGQGLAGWILWNNPDGSGPLAVEPKKFASMAKIADQWRRRYCPEKPLLIGGMSSNTAIPYLRKLGKQNALEHVSGVNVRMDVGRLSPEDAEIVNYIEELRSEMPQAEEHRYVLVTDLDWAVEKEGSGLCVFDQAAFLTRSYMMLNRFGIRPVLQIANEDYDRLGLGLAYRDRLYVPPMRARPSDYHFKPSWWAMARVRELFGNFHSTGSVEISDIIPGQTRCLLFEKSGEDVTVVVLWRLYRPGEISFENTGLEVTESWDLFGTPIKPTEKWFSVGKMPTAFRIPVKPTVAEQALRLLQVKSPDGLSWPQTVISVIKPGGKDYKQTGGQKAVFKGKTVTARSWEGNGLRFKKGGSEEFSVPVPKDYGLVLRKRFLLEEIGQDAEVAVNGKKVAEWNLRRHKKQLSGGVRDSSFFIGRKHLKNSDEAKITVKYPDAANTIEWRIFAYREGAFPLSALGPLYAEQNVGHIRFGRNSLGMPLKIAGKSFKNGLGTFARSLVEYQINGQFKKLKAEVGVDAVTEGKGSVVFKVFGDGEELWSSPVMSGLDEARPVEIDVSSVDRLRLVVDNAGDGNRYDAANWGRARLLR